MLFIQIFSLTKKNIHNLLGIQLKCKSGECVMATVLVYLIMNFSSLFKSDSEQIQYHANTVFMPIIVLYAFCFRFIKNILDMSKGYIQPWEDIDHFEQILTRYCLDNTLLGLKYFFVKNVCCYFSLFFVIYSYTIVVGS